MKCECTKKSPNLTLNSGPTRDQQILVISCEKDKATYSKAIKKGFKVHGAEILLTGLLRHELDLNTYLLK